MEKLIQTTEDLQEALSQVKFINSVLNFNWQFEFRPVEIHEENKSWMVKKAWLVHVSFERPDINSGKVGRGRSRDEIVWQGTTLSGAVKTGYVLLKLTIEHELMEGFHWNAARIFNPHNTIEELAELARNHQLAITEKFREAARAK